MTDVPKDIMEAARRAYFDPFNGGDSAEGSVLIMSIARALLAERERCTAQGVTPEIVETMCSSPIIEALTPTVYEMSACQTVQDEYNLMKRRIRKAFAAHSLPTSAGGGE